MDEPNTAERRRSAEWIGREADGLLTLLDVVALKNRNAWVHRPVEALGLVHLVDLPDPLRPPIRIAAEIVASAAATLSALGPAGHTHSGPTPEDLALDPDGRTWLTGFASPWPRSPLFRDPSGAEGQEAAVWRLGVLLALLLGGRVPAVNDSNAHEAMVRRVLIRAMSRSGPMFTERYRDWVQGMLAWDADQRPALSSVAPGLREVASKIEGPSIAAWAAQQVPLRIRQVLDRAEMLEATADTDVSYHPWNTDPDPSEDLAGQDTGAPIGMRTLPGVPLSALERDDITAESTLINGEARLKPPMVEPGTMPVGIGPPIEALKQRPTLPRDFLQHGPEPREAQDSRSLTDWVQLGLLALLVAVLFGLLGLVGLVWLLGFAVA